MRVWLLPSSSLVVACAPPSPEALSDPCAGLGVPVVDALSDSVVVLGCSDHGGLWWSTDSGRTFRPVARARRWSVVDLWTTDTQRVHVWRGPSRPSAVVEVDDQGQPHIALGPSPSPPSPSSTVPFPGTLNDWTRRADQILAVGSPAGRPHDGLALHSVDGGRSWTPLPGSPPVLESVTHAGGVYWIAGDGYLVRGRW